MNHFFIFFYFQFLGFDGGMRCNEFPSNELVFISCCYRAFIKYCAVAKLQKLVDSLPSKDLETSGKHSHDTSSSSSSSSDDDVVDGRTTSLASVRSIALLAALSVHVVLEGLAIGMQDNAAEVYTLQ